MIASTLSNVALFILGQGPSGPTGDPAATGATSVPAATGPSAVATGPRVEAAVEKARATVGVVEQWFRDNGYNVLGALVILVGAWIISGWARRTIRRASDRARMDPTLGKFFSNLARWGILALAIVTSLNLFGIGNTSFAALLGAAGLALGLGFQGSLSHFASGVMLLVFRPFKVGDSVIVAGQAGKVNEIDLLITEIDTADGRRIIVPNGQIFGAIIENTSHHPRRRADVVVPVPMTVNVDRTRKLLERAGNSVRPRLESEPIEVSPLDFVTTNLTWAVRVWTTREEYGATRDALVRAVKLAVDEATNPHLEASATPTLTVSPPAGTRS